jgi:hypothetical protein
MIEKPIKNSYQIAKARELNKKIKAGRIQFTDQEAIIYQAGKLAGEQETKKRTV